jgi:hypothetical protein
MGEKKCFRIIDQACSQEHADGVGFFEIPLHTVPKQLKSGCRHHCGFSADFKHFVLRWKPKMIMDIHSIKFLAGCSAPFSCNLNYADFHEFLALGLI